MGDFEDAMAGASKKIAESVAGRREKEIQAAKEAGYDWLHEYTKRDPLARDEFVESLSISVYFIPANTEHATQPTGWVHQNTFDLRS